jgi:hypothetical protein
MKELFTPPVIWLLIGLAFLLLEIAIPGLIIFFFGLGAWIVALLFVFFDPGLTVQLLVFAVSSVFLLLLLFNYEAGHIFPAFGFIHLRRCFQILSFFYLCTAAS